MTLLLTPAESRCAVFGIPLGRLDSGLFLPRQDLTHVSGPVWAPCPTEVTNPNNDPTEFLQPEFCGEGRLCPAPEDEDDNPDLEKVQNTNEPDKVEDVDGGEKAVEEKNHDSGN